MKNNFFIVLFIIVLLFSSAVSVYADDTNFDNTIVYNDIENNVDDNYAVELFSDDYSYTPSIFTVIIDPLFEFMKWILSGFPDASYETSGNWFDEIIMVAQYALWFFPSDLLNLCFTTISFWLSTQLVMAAIHFILKFIPFIGGGS